MIARPKRAPYIDYNGCMITGPDTRRLLHSAGGNFQMSPQQWKVAAIVGWLLAVMGWIVAAVTT